MNIDDIRLTPEEILIALYGHEVGMHYPVKLTKGELADSKTIANKATDKANKWWIGWVERALIVHPDNRRTWKSQYLEALKKLVKPNQE